MSITAWLRCRAPITLSVGLVLGTASPSRGVAQWAAEVRAEGRLFAAGLERSESAVEFRVRRFFPRRSGDLAVAVSARVDPVTADRNRFDIDELAWLGALGSVDITVGFREISWGVLESRGIVDVVNQRAPERRWPGVDKLGQPMLGVSWPASWGEMEVLLLPWARTRPLGGMRGQLWSGRPVAVSAQRYTGDLPHLAWAVRWSRVVGAWDLGASYFGGTARDPRFASMVTAAGVPSVAPRYDRVQHVGLDLRRTGDRWIWKAEIASADPATGRYVSFGGGVEYQPAAYLSLFGEFLYDGRGREAVTSLERDAFIGARLLYPDGRISGGAYLDVATGNVIGAFEFTRRFGAETELVLELRGFWGREDREPRFALREHDTIALAVRRHF